MVEQKLQEHIMSMTDIKWKTQPYNIELAFTMTEFPSPTGIFKTWKSHMNMNIQPSLS
jgi:hypothetical protein